MNNNIDLTPYADRIVDFYLNSISPDQVDHDKEKLKELSQHPQQYNVALSGILAGFPALQNELFPEGQDNGALEFNQQIPEVPQQQTQQGLPQGRYGYYEDGTTPKERRQERRAFRQARRRARRNPGTDQFSNNFNEGFDPQYDPEVFDQYQTVGNDPITANNNLMPDPRDPSLRTSFADLPSEAGAVQNAKRTVFNENNGTYPEGLYYLDGVLTRNGQAVSEADTPEHLRGTFDETRIERNQPVARPTNRPVARRNMVDDRYTGSSNSYYDPRPTKLDQITDRVISRNNTLNRNQIIDNRYSPFNVGNTVRDNTYSRRNQGSITRTDPETGYIYETTATGNNGESLVEIYNPDGDLLESYRDSNQKVDQMFNRLQRYGGIANYSKPTKKRKKKKK